MRRPVHAAQQAWVSPLSRFEPDGGSAQSSPSENTRGISRQALIGSRPTRALIIRFRFIDLIIERDPSHQHQACIGLRIRLSVSVFVRSYSPPTALQRASRFATVRTFDSLVSRSSQKTYSVATPDKNTRYHAMHLVLHYAYADVLQKRETLSPRDRGWGAQFASSR